MPLQATSGAASYDAFGGGVVAEPNYIESCFSTWLYTGNGSTQTINNGIDLAGKGGLVWQKSRDTTAGYQHVLYDTVRGSTSALFSSVDSDAITSGGTYTTTFSSTGFQTNTSGGNINQSGNTQVSWTFREQPKFFDVVTYTGNGQNNRQIAHNLGSVPGCIMVKRTNAAADWYVYHRGLNGGVNPQNHFILLNSTAAQGTYEVWENTAPTSTVFTVDEFSSVNGSGDTFVAYLFAHNAGGFGLSGTDNVITCGSFTTDGSANASVTLGYEPQWVMARPITTGDWFITDVMRGASQTNSEYLLANTSGAAGTTGVSSQTMIPTATGFNVKNWWAAGTQLIYIAIRRGPMRTPTTGTSVFTPIASEFNEGQVNTTNFPVDLQISRIRGVTNNTWAVDRLRGVLTRPATGNAPFLSTNLTNAEANSTLTRNWNNTGFETAFTQSGWATAYWNFRRAPGFFDEVCYTGTGTSGQTYAHNLGVAPELMIVKRRDAVNSWAVYSSALASSEYLELNSTAAKTTGVNRFNGTAPTSSVFTVGNSAPTNVSGGTYVNYLFASCPGVSKVGSYTGNGGSQTINCGFAGGARFVMIKATNTTGDWLVWDTARGINAGDDPRLALNSTTAEVADTDSIDASASGFIVNNDGNLTNASGTTYIYLAIA